MPYVRLTADEWQIWQCFAGTWEEVSAYDNRADCKRDLLLYRANQPEYPARMVKRRVKP